MAGAIEQTKKEQRVIGPARRLYSFLFYLSSFIFYLSSFIFPLPSFIFYF